MKKLMMGLKSVSVVVLFAVALAGCPGTEEQVIEAFCSKSAQCNPFPGLDQEQLQKLCVSSESMLFEAIRKDPRCAPVADQNEKTMACMSELSCGDLKRIVQSKLDPWDLPSGFPCRQELIASRDLEADKTLHDCFNIALPSPSFGGGSVGEVEGGGEGGGLSWEIEIEEGGEGGASSAASSSSGG